MPFQLTVDLSCADNKADPLIWKKVNTKPLSTGLNQEVSNSQLSAALVNKAKNSDGNVEFTQEEWKGFKVDPAGPNNDIMFAHHFIKVNNEWYIPANRKVLEQQGKFEIEVSVSGESSGPCPEVGGSVKIHADAIDKEGKINKVCECIICI